MIFAWPAAPVVWTLAGVFAILAAASLAARLARDLPSELGPRIRSWWIMVAVFSLALLLSRTGAIALFGLVSFIAFKEYLSLIPTRRADRQVLFWAYLAIPFQYYWVADDWYGMFLIFIPVYLFLGLALRMVIDGATDGFLRAVGTLHWGLMITVFSLSHGAYLLNLPLEGNPVAGGVGLLTYLVVLTQANDVLQYVWGRSLGRHAVIPKVSPNKTWEGLLGGVASTSLAAVLLAPLLTPFTLWHSLLAGLLIGIGGFCGDVTISAVKRDLGVKDTSTLLPGHGGMLDRVDSLTFTAPLFFHFTYYLYF